MGHDPFGPISLAQINVLCVPVGKLSSPKFEEYIRAFKAFSVIPLKSLIGTSSRSTYKDGHILLNIGKYSSAGGVEVNQQLDLNVNPQIAVGTIDGELLATSSPVDQQEWLRSMSAALGQNARSWDETVLPILVVFGGGHLKFPNDCLFVDIEGDGPSLPDVVQVIVSRYLVHLEDAAQSLVTQPAPNTVDRDITQSPVLPVSDQAGGSPIKGNNPKAGSGINNIPLIQRDDGNMQQAFLLSHRNLLAGQWPEALRHFSQGAIEARNKSNYWWYAKNLEGSLVSMLLLAWAHLEFIVPQICYPTNDRKEPVYNSSSMAAICTANRSALETILAGKTTTSGHTLTLLIPHLLSTIINLYERASDGFQDIAGFMSLADARIRWGNLLVTLKQCGSALQDDALQAVVEGTSTGVVAQRINVSASSLVLQKRALMRLFSDAALEIQTRISVRRAAPFYMAVAAGLSRLGLDRKHAFYLRDFLRRLGPALVEAHRIGAAELGLHPSATLPPLDLNKSGQSQSGILELLLSVCASYGLPKTRKRQEISESTPQEHLRDALQTWSEAHQTGDVMMKIDVLCLCVEVCSAIPDLQNTLLFITQVLQICIGKPTLDAGTSDATPLISEEEQSRLLVDIRKAVNKAIQYELPNIRASYWDKCMVRAIELSGEPEFDRLIPRTARDLSLVSNVKNEMRKDPFIFNPFAKTKAGLGQSVVVVGEQARFNVILQNPLQVEVEIEDIMLLTTGCDFQADHHSIVLGPMCSQAFSLTGVAQSQGDLVVSGCRATVRGCYSADFLIVHGDWKALHSAKRTTGLSKSEAISNISLPNIESLTLKAIAPIPKLSIASTSLPQSSLMLLEGEKTTFRLTLRNHSNLDVDLVLITFEDSVTKRLEEALSNKDLLPVDVYEFQNQIASRPVIRLSDTQNDSHNIRIPALRTVDFSVTLFGRPGLTDVTILVDYTYIGKPQEEIQGSFYTRQLRYTIDTTVNGSIDILRCLTLPVESSIIPISEGQVVTQGLLPVVKELVENKGEKCMLLLDVRNIWPQPLDVEFVATKMINEAVVEPASEHNTFRVVETLQPGQMTRLLLLIPRILVRDPYAPIPSLDSRRQFVVSASKMTIEAEAATRETFWYRERLLEYIRATWREHGGSRNGQVDMRKGIRLNSRMIDALRIDLVDISFSMKDTDATPEDDHMPGSCINVINTCHFSLLRNRFASVVAKIHNRSSEDLMLLLRLQPSLRNQPHNIALDMSRRLAWTGVLQRALRPPLQPNESREIELGVIALAEGEYEVNATAEEIKSRTSKGDNTSHEPGSGIERRIWHARHPCLIDAIDPIHE